MVHYINMTRVILLSLQSNPRQKHHQPTAPTRPKFGQRLPCLTTVPSNTYDSSNRKIRRLRIESRKVGDNNLNVLAPNSYRTRKNPTPPSQLRAYTNLPRIGRRRKTPISVNPPVFLLSDTKCQSVFSKFFPKASLLKSFRVRCPQLPCQPVFRPV